MKIPEPINNLAAGVLRTLAGLITKPRVTREAALFVDVVTALALAIVPKYGWALCLGYFVLRDTLSTTGQGAGKALYKLRIYKVKDHTPVGWKLAILRSILILMPLVNIADLFHFIRTGRRYVDEWIGVDVFPETVDNVSDNAPVEKNPPLDE